MTRKPTNSPWGRVQHCSEVLDGGLAPGQAYWASTAGHGGLMLHASIKSKLSEKCVQLGSEVFGEYLCFEEDCAWALAYFELGIDKAMALQTVIAWYPEYLSKEDVAGLDSDLAADYRRSLSRSQDSARRDEQINAKNPDYIRAALGISSVSDFNRFLDLKLPLDTHTGVLADLLDNTDRSFFNRDLFLRKIEGGLNNCGLCLVVTADDQNHIVDNYINDGCPQLSKSGNVIFTIKSRG